MNERDEVCLTNGTTAFVTGTDLEKLDEKILVYNIEVADFKTYFVCNVPVLVYNYNKKRKQDYYKK